MKLTLLHEGVLSERLYRNVLDLKNAVEEMLSTINRTFKRSLRIAGGRPGEGFNIFPSEVTVREGNIRFSISAGLRDIRYPYQKEFIVTPGITGIPHKAGSKKQEKLRKWKSEIDALLSNPIIYSLKKAWTFSRGAEKPRPRETELMQVSVKGEDDTFYEMSESGLEELRGDILSDVRKVMYKEYGVKPKYD